VRRIFAAVGTTMLVDSLLYLAILPLLPYYSERFDLSTTETALLLSGYQIAFVATAVPSGWLAGRYGPRRVVIAGLICFTASSAVFAFAPTVAILLVARALQGIAGGIGWSAAMSWLTENSPPERRSRNVGLVSGILSAGAVAGPGVGALAGATSPELAFGLVAAAGAIALVLTLLAPAGRTPPRDPPMLETSAKLIRNRLVLTALCFAGVQASGIAALDLLAILELGRRGESTLTIGLALSIGAVLGIGAGGVAGRLGERFGSFRLCLGAGAILSLLPLVAAFGLPTWALLGLLFLVGPLFPALMTGVFPITTAGADQLGLAHGTANGFVNVCWSGMFGVVPLVVGPLSQATGDAVAYVTTFALMVALLGTAVALRTTSRPVAA
jgi:MFS family permease